MDKKLALLCAVEVALRCQDDALFAATILLAIRDCAPPRPLNRPSETSDPSSA